MQRKARKADTYSRSYKRFIVNAVIRDGISIPSICMQEGIDHPFSVREWVREEMKKRELVRIPKTLYRRGKAPLVQISAAVNRQFEEYEEYMIYFRCIIEQLLHHMDEETKKKVFSQLSKDQQRRLQLLIKKSI